MYCSFFKFCDGLAWDKLTQLISLLTSFSCFLRE